MFSLNGKSVAAGSPPPPGQEGVPPHWTTYIASDDADATAEKIRAPAAPSSRSRSTSSTRAG